MHDGRRVEERLAAAIADFTKLKRLRQRIASAGVDVQEEFQDPQLQAIALLGEYDRGRIVANVGPFLEHLAKKGLIASGTLSTAELRLLDSLGGQRLQGILSIEERIRVQLAHPAKSDQPSLIRCVSSVRGEWGQKIRVPVLFADETERIFVWPDDIFGVQGLSGRHVETSQDRLVTMEFPCDEGEIIIAAVSRTAEIANHRLRVEVER